MKKALRIALIGSRGIPARYSGFETFYEQIGVRLAQRGHQVTVYNRSHFIRDVHDTYCGVRIVSLPSIPTKHLDTLTHTALSSLHALFQKYDVVYYCIVGNSPLAWIPRLAGSKVLLNVDGADWAREKWGPFARWYQRHCERVATRVVPTLIADSRVIQERYRTLYNAETIFAPYGANICRDERVDALNRWGLKPRKYLLYVGRLVPENAVDMLIRAFGTVATPMNLVIIGDAPFSDDYKASLRAMADSRVIFTGYAFGDEYAQLSSHAYLAVQPSAIDGTRPALLDQMGFGNCIVFRDSAANVETLGGYGEPFEGKGGVQNLARKLAELVADPRRCEHCREGVVQRISQYYNWEWITDFHEDLFRRLIAGSGRISYYEFIANR